MGLKPRLPGLVAGESSNLELMVLVSQKPGKWDLKSKEVGELPGPWGPDGGWKVLNPFLGDLKEHP